MKVWIDPDLCTGDGICEEITPEVFAANPNGNGLWVVKEEAKHFGETKIFDGATAATPDSLQGLARIPDSLLDSVVESAEECPGECIFIEE